MRPLRIIPNESARSEEHTSELQSQSNLVCRLLLEKKKQIEPVHHGNQHIDEQGHGREVANGHHLVDEKGVGRELPHESHRLRAVSVFFFFNDTATTEIYTLSLHDALPIFDVVGVANSATEAARMLGDREV